MAKSEFFTDRGFFVRAFMKMCGVFAVKRNTSDRRSVNKASEILSEENVVGIFPQGKIVTDGTFEPKSGAALLSVKNGVPVLPVSIYVNGAVRPFRKITVRFGEVLMPPDDDSLKTARDFTKIIKEHIYAQLEEQH